MRYLTVDNVALIVILLTMVGAIAANLLDLDVCYDCGVPNGPETGVNMWY